MSPNIKALLPFALPVLLASCISVPVEVASRRTGSPEAEAQRAKLVGMWYGSYQDESNRKVCWLADNQENGDFLVRFRTNQDPEKELDGEFGTWGISGDIKYVTTQGWIKNGKIVVAQPGDTTLQDAYRITKLTDTEVEYTHVANNHVNKGIKVDRTFSMPPCK